jgi:hypothetical protein
MNFLQHLALQENKLNDSLRLDFVEIARVPDMFPSFFLPGRVKDLSAPRYCLAQAVTLPP